MQQNLIEHDVGNAPQSGSEIGAGSMQRIPRLQVSKLQLAQFLDTFNGNLMIPELTKDKRRFDEVCLCSGIRCRSQIAGLVVNEDYDFPECQRDLHTEQRWV